MFGIGRVKGKEREGFVSGMASPMKEKERNKNNFV
jgi:hypothetical protein